MSLGIPTNDINYAHSIVHIVHVDGTLIIVRSGRNLPERVEVKELLENKLKEMNQKGELPDVITFAGNGEPTLHPEFAEIIDDTIE